MLLRGIVLFIFLSSLLFVAYRFGIIGTNLPSQPVTEISNTPTISPTIVTTSLSQAQKVSSTSAKILLLEAPEQATASVSFLIKWFIDNPKIATISHTAIHYSPDARPNPKLPSDYPEKSVILKGTIPATFSAELKIPLAGIYYYRTHAIVDDANIWSEEKTITIVSTSSAIPTP